MCVLAQTKPDQRNKKEQCFQSPERARISWGRATRVDGPGEGPYRARGVLYKWALPKFNSGNVPSPAMLDAENDRAGRSRSADNQPSTYPISERVHAAALAYPRLRRASTPYREVITGDSVNMKSTKANQCLLPLKIRPSRVRGQSRSTKDY